MLNILKKALVILLTVAFAVSGIYMPALAEDEELVNIINSTLESYDDVLTYSNFSFVDWAYTRCGYSAKRNILVNTAASAELVFDAGEDMLFKKAEFKVTIHQNDAWMLNQETHRNKVFLTSADGITYNAVAPASYATGDITYDGTIAHHNYTLNYEIPEGVRYVKLTCFSINTNRFFVHNVKLDGVANDVTDDDTVTDNEENLLLDDAFLSSVNAKNVKGFMYTNASGNCGLVRSNVAYRTGTGDAYAIYDLTKYKSVDTAKFDVTVGANYRYQITDTGALGDILFYSTDGISFVPAVANSAYNASYEEVSTQKNHYTYTLTYTVPVGAKLLKFDATKFANWGFYLHGVRFYGESYADEYQEPVITPPDGHYIVKGDFGWSGLSAYTDEAVGFSTDPFIAYKVNSPARNINYKSSAEGAEGYFVYSAPNNGSFSMVELLATVSGFYSCDLLTGVNALDNNLYASADGVSFTPVTGGTATPEFDVIDGSVPYVSFRIRAILPEGTKYFKFDASEFGSWHFMYTDVKLYGPSAVFDYSTVDSLYKAYEDYFDIAVAIEPDNIYTYNEIIETQFNELTIENQMKPTVMHPSEDKYQWAYTDAIVDYAMAHGKKVRGHGLVYEKAMPGWFFVDADGNQASKELVLQRLEEHVRTIVRRYKGKIYAYDVVNENFGHNGWDTRTLSDIVGVDEYTRKVFQWAHEEDPDAILILNDNYYDVESKRNNIYNYVKGLVDDGVPIHGIGFQDHHFIDTDPAAVDATLTLFEQIPDFKLFITELDIRSCTTEGASILWPDYMTDEVKEVVARKYATMFDVYRRHADRIETVGFWNVCDKTNWVNASGMNHPATLFGFNGEPNPAFFSVLDIDGKLPRWEGGTKLPVFRNNDYTIDVDNNDIIVKGNSAGNVEVTVTSAGDDILSSDLTAANASVTVSDFIYPDWNAYSRCGFNDARAVYTSNSNAAYMIFDAGNIKANYAEFNITAHRDKRWQFTDPGNIGTLIKFSDDGVTWTDADSSNTTYMVTGGPVSDAGTLEGNTPWYTYKITVNLDTPVKYIKLDAAGHGVSGMYVHYAKLAHNSALSSITFTADGNWQKTLDIPAISDYDGTKSPDYVLTVVDGNGIKIDNFTYYRTDIRNTDYTIVDHLNDNSKAYRMLRTTLVSGSSRCNNDDAALQPLYFWGTANIGSGEVVYKVKDGFKAKEFTLNMFTNDGARFNVYVSKDDITYTEASVNWKWQGVNLSGYSNYIGTLSNISEDTVYIKIDMGTYKYHYLSEVTLSVAKRGLKLDNSGLTINGERTYALASGNMGAACSITNTGADDSNVSIVFAVYNGSGLVNAALDAKLCPAGETVDFSAVIENYTASQGDYCKVFFVEDLINLKPVFDIQTY